MVKNPVTLRLSDLLDPTKFSPVTLPVTLVCAGNRRKEQNVVRQSLGFSWGPAGLSTALFTGVFLADVLTFVNPQNEGVFGSPGFKRAEHVIFEGAEDLPNGKYGTSQRLRWARQKTKGMLLAWAMNGEVCISQVSADLLLIYFLNHAGSGTRSWIPSAVGGTRSNRR